VLAALVAGEAGGQELEIEGDRGVLEDLRAMVVLPERLRQAGAFLREAGPAGRRLSVIEPCFRTRRSHHCRSSAEVLPSSWRADDQQLDLLVPSKMSRILASRAHFSSSSFSP
jgi:hypothetical protein